MALINRLFAQRARSPATPKPHQRRTNKAADRAKAAAAAETRARQGAKQKRNQAMASVAESAPADIGDIAIPDNARSYVAVRGRVVYIATGKENDVLVRNYLSALMRQRVDFEKRFVSVAEIAKITETSQTRVTHTFTERDCIDLIKQAVNTQASDIHIHNHMNSSSSTILFRVNGSLREIMELSFEDGESLCRTFYGPLASVKDTEWQPSEFQDARVAGRSWFPEGVYSLRIASTPTDDGSRMVIRVLYDVTSAASSQVTGVEALKSLGFAELHIDAFQEMLGRPSGMNIFSGPTGSGKSTTIKYELERVMRRFPDLHLITVEDPPEYPIHNATQIPLSGVMSRSSSGRKEGYSDRIRASMRLDPDLMMIGEVRDGASAKAAIEAAQTGHKVWTTLHANNAWDILDRYESLLGDAGIGNSRTLLANISNVSGLIAQRLVRKLCPDCSIPIENAIRGNRMHKDTLAQLEAVFDDMSAHNIRVRGDGCNTCQGHLSLDERANDPNRGISGRTVVAESIAPDFELMEMYRREGPGEAKRFWTQERASKTYVRHAIEKIRDGVVDPESAITVVGDLTWDYTQQD